MEQIKEKVKRWENLEEYNKEIERKEVESAIKRAKNGTASGDDKITNEIIKKGGEEAYQIILINWLNIFLFYYK